MTDFERNQLLLEKRRVEYELAEARMIVLDLERELDIINLELEM